jgi:hypothetical protein
MFSEVASLAQQIPTVSPAALGFRRRSFGLWPSLGTTLEIIHNRSKTSKLKSLRKESDKAKIILLSFLDLVRN